MKNLAGDKEADIYVQEELLLADIALIRGQPAKGEVPSTIVGKLGNWTFERAWYYWVASVPERGQGLPLEIAAQLHEKQYPVIGEKQPQTYGQVVRVAGHCGCPHPKKWAFPTREVLEVQIEKLDKEGKLDALNLTHIERYRNPLPGFKKSDQICFGDLSTICNSGLIQGERFVDTYHIDTRLGLNEFAKVVKQL